MIRDDAETERIIADIKARQALRDNTLIKMYGPQCGGYRSNWTENAFPTADDIDDFNAYVDRLFRRRTPTSD